MIFSLVTGGMNGLINFQNHENTLGGFTIRATPNLSGKWLLRMDTVCLQTLMDGAFYMWRLLHLW